jgi:hypothetical protein
MIDVEVYFLIIKNKTESVKFVFEPVFGLVKFDHQIHKPRSYNKGKRSIKNRATKEALFVIFFVVVH